MKKVLFILSILSVILLFSFSKKNTYSVVKHEIKWRSVHFSVTANCGDGSHGYSDPVLIYF